MGETVVIVEIVNRLKSLEFVLNITFSVFKYFLKTFREYIRMEKPSYKSENIERKYLSNMRKN